MEDEGIKEIVHFVLFHVHEEQREDARLLAYENIKQSGTRCGEETLKE